MKQLREKLDLTQQQLADAIQVSQPTIAAWERGSRYPHPKVGLRLVDFCVGQGMEVSLEDIYNNWI